MLSSYGEYKRNQIARRPGEDEDELTDRFKAIRQQPKPVAVGAPRVDEPAAPAPTVPAVNPSAPRPTPQVPGMSPAGSVAGAAPALPGRKTRTTVVDPSSFRGGRPSAGVGAVAPTPSDESYWTLVSTQPGGEQEWRGAGGEASIIAGASARNGGSPWANAARSSSGNPGAGQQAGEPSDALRRMTEETIARVQGGGGAAGVAGGGAAGGPAAGGYQRLDSAPDWYDRLWGMTTDRPEYDSIDASLSGRTTGALDAAAQQRARAGASLGEYSDVDPTRSADVDRLRRHITEGATRSGPDYNYGDVDAVNNVQGLDDRLMSAASGYLDAPGRYDTDLFDSLLDRAMTRIGGEQDKSMLQLRRDANTRLGPRSGQLTNENIDLADSMDGHRRDITLDLLREAALTNATDRSAAIDSARGVSSDVFGRGSSLRNEQRAERDFDFTTDRVREGDRLANLSAAAGVQGQLFNQDASDRNELRSEREFDWRRDTTNIDNAARAAELERAGAESAYNLERGVRDENRGERDFKVQDRLAGLQEVASFGAIDRQLGRDSMDDYFRHADSELNINESKARLAQQEFANNLALAQLYAGMPSEVGGGTGGQAGDNVPAERPQYGNGARGWAQRYAQGSGDDPAAVTRAVQDIATVIFGSASTPDAQNWLAYGNQGTKLTPDKLSMITSRLRVRHHWKDHAIAQFLKDMGLTGY